MDSERSGRPREYRALRTRARRVAPRGVGRRVRPGSPCPRFRGRRMRPGSARCERPQGRPRTRDPRAAGRPGGRARRQVMAVAVDPARALLAGRPGTRARDGASRRLRARPPPGGLGLRTRAGRDARSRPGGAPDELRHVRRRRCAGPSRACRLPAGRRAAGSLDLPRDARPRAPRGAACRVHRRAPGRRRSRRPSSAGARPASCSTAVATEYGAAIPDVAGIAGVLATARPGAWLVVDTTGAPLAASPLALPEARDGRLGVLAIESLTKHAQLGLDRVTAGAIYASHGEAAALDELREHLGANIPDALGRTPSPPRTVQCSPGGWHATRAMPPPSPRAWRPSPRGRRDRTSRTPGAPGARPAAGDLADAATGNARTRRSLRRCSARTRTGAGRRAGRGRQLRARHDPRLRAVAG